jgi:shikimate kinase
LGWDWLDADAVLEMRSGKSIRQMFAEDGEPAFRDLESEILAELCQRQRHVIATGGGLVLRAENRDRLRAAGRVVWLTADPATLWQRLQEDAATPHRRPDLSSGGQAEIEELMRVRQPLYAACAHFTVDTVGRSAEDVAGIILKTWLAQSFSPLPSGERRES